MNTKIQCHTCKYDKQVCHICVYQPIDNLDTPQEQIKEFKNSGKEVFNELAIIRKLKQLCDKINEKFIKEK